MEGGGTGEVDGWIGRREVTGGSGWDLGAQASIN